MNKTICKNHCYMAGDCPAGINCFIRCYLALGGAEKYEVFRRQTIDEFNSLHIPEIPKVTELVPIKGSGVNFAFRMPNKESFRLLNDGSIYLGSIVVQEFVTFCFVAGMDFLLAFSYIEDCTEPELIFFKRR